MSFFNDILYTISHSQAFLIVISGVLIYTTQQLVSQLWLEPVKEFKKCLSKIETLMNRWDFLHNYTISEKQSTSLEDSHGTLDERVKNFRRQLNDIATDLIYTYNALPRMEKWVLRIQGYDFIKAKVSLLTLSAIVSKSGDWLSGESKARAEIDSIYSALRLSQYLRSKF